MISTVKSEVGVMVKCNQKERFLRASGILKVNKKKAGGEVEAALYSHRKSKKLKNETCMGI